jgi:hypothetical protein
MNDFNFRVEQLINDRNNPAANQFVIYGEGKKIFQSYDSIIAVVDYNNKTIELGRDWNYSRTTGKHRNIFFRDYANIPDLASLDGISKALKNGLCNGWSIKLVA